MRQVRRKEEDNIQRFATSTPVDNDDDNNPSIIRSDNTNSNHVKTEMTNGRPKNVIENGINTISNHVNKQKTNNSIQGKFYFLFNNE